MGPFQRCVVFLLVHLCACLSQTIRSGLEIGDAPNGQGTSGTAKALYARQAFVRDCERWQEQAIVASTQQLAAVVLEGVLASEHRVLYEEVDEELRRIFDNMWMQTRPSPPDDQMSVHFVLQRVWDAAYFTSTDDRVLTAPGARIPPGQAVRITCQDVQNRCRGSKPLYITNRRGEGREDWAGGSTIVIVSSIVRLPENMTANGVDAVYAFLQTTRPGCEPNNGARSVLVSF